MTKKLKKETVVIYTDGSYKHKTKVGGWSCVMECREHSKEIYGYLEPTTINQMELVAPIIALSQLTKPCKITIYSDSIYVVKGFNNWSKNWIRNGWVKKDSTTVLNKDLWLTLLKYKETHSIKFVWVKSHQNSDDKHALMNNRADELAQKAADGKVCNWK